VSTPVAERLASQLLSGPPATGVADVVDRLLAVQAQDLRAARLAVRARSTGLVASDVDRALADGSHVVSWLNRGTLHLVSVEDHWWLHALTTPAQRSNSDRRLVQEGVVGTAVERGVRAVRTALAGGPRTRAELREAVAAADVPVARQALVHVLFRASLDGHLTRGPVAGGEQLFVATEQLGPRPRLPDREVLLGELARRYLVGHGPADAADLARWAGIRLTDARTGLRGVRHLVERPDGLVDLPGRPAAPDLPPPRLLGGFEPLLLGWVSRDAVLGGHTSLVTTNGLFRPFALADGRAVATWGLPRGQVTVTLLGDGELAPDVAAALDRDARAVERFLAG